MAPERTGGWRLAEAKSAYLREASEQPIEWRPWGTEAFELAQKSGRPVLLDIGASWCHWCHVMDQGTYSDPEVGRLVNQHFIAIKVDRDENPEVDRRFQRQVGALTGEGGWPLTAFLTPTGEAFLGGTYFPVEDAMGRPGFRRVLKEVSRLWTEEPGRLTARTKDIQRLLSREETSGPAELSTPERFVDSVAEHIESSFDPVHGGFGQAPKFPHPTAISLLLWRSFDTGNPAASEKALRTLRGMADGGIYDQVGGGFHRYSVDEGWHIPHFEKMTSDNAALLSVFAEGSRRFPDHRLLETVTGTSNWLLHVLQDPEGGFGASQDADNAPGDDGSYFTWSRPELKAVLDPSELRLVTRFFGVGSEGRMPHDPDRNVLFRLMTLPESAEGTSIDPAQAEIRLGQAIQKLASARALRHPPTVDTALYSNLNGSVTRALVAASRVTGDARLLSSAKKAADRFLAHAYSPDTGMAHVLEGADGRAHGLLDDQVEFASGMVELAGATLLPKYLEAATSLFELILREYRDDSGVLRDLAPRLYDGPPIPGLSFPSYPLEDQPHLSANAGAALGLLRLSSLTDQPRWREEAARLVAAAERRLSHAGLFAAGTALAAGLLSTEPARIVVEGEGPEAEALFDRAQRSWHPQMWTFSGPPPPPFSVGPLSDGVPRSKSKARALVCFGTRCLAPVTNPEELSRILPLGKTAAAG